METTDGGTHEYQVQANALLIAICTGTMLIYGNIWRGQREKITLDVFITNNNHLTRQIIITETSMSDHSIIIQIETNVKIVEEKQNHQIKKSNFTGTCTSPRKTSVGQVFMLTCLTRVHAVTCF